MIKLKASTYRINFDLHRAGGLWFWGLLMIMAVSSVYLNLQNEVFKPVVSTFLTVTPSVFDQREPKPPEAPLSPRVSRENVLARAEEEAQKRDWTPLVIGIFYDAQFGVYGVGFGKEEHPMGLGNPWLYFDGTDGHLAGDEVPGQGTAGDLLMQLQFPLHSGQIAGLAGRIIVSMTGLVVTILSITGVVIYLKKRRGRLTGRTRTSLSRVEPIQTTDQ